jgi:hypothetical protein
VRFVPVVARHKAWLFLQNGVQFWINFEIHHIQHFMPIAAKAVGRDIEHQRKPLTVRMPYRRLMRIMLERVVNHRVIFVYTIANNISTRHWPYPPEYLD